MHKTYRIMEYAELIKASFKTVYRHIAEGKLKTVTFSRTDRVIVIEDPLVIEILEARKLELAKAKELEQTDGNNSDK